jgi:hypothetical protein
MYGKPLIALAVLYPTVVVLGILTLAHRRHAPANAQVA